MSNKYMSGRKQWQMKHKKGKFNPKVQERLAKSKVNPGSFLANKRKKKI